MANPFSKFKVQTKKVKIKALDNAEVTVQELSVAQSTDFYKRVVKGFDENGKVELNYNELADIKIEKVAAGMIEPYMSLDELKGLANGANKAIDEIAEAIDNFEAELKK
jgi:hypothetical protein